MKVTGLHNLFEHFIDSTSLVAYFNTSAFTLNSLSRSGATNTSLVIKTFLSLSNTCCCSSSYCHFTSFLVNIFIGLATQAKSLINLL